ncbi:MAG TPA: class I SAM-dependent methyltransferase [Magnetospirillum sp.]|nr:class I SAM-dependent methyltransferase [Magnetospirillum sp.]
MTSSCTGFYSSYADYKGYETPRIGHKEIARFDADIWYPAQCSPYDSFLEIGCGTGAFLGYLAAKKVTRFHGIDHDPALAQVVPEPVRDHFSCADVWAYLADPEVGPFDRVVLLDVLEHFTPDDAARLLDALRPRLNEGARVVVKVPNASSPWALQWQNGDLTHRTAFTPLSLKQLAGFAGYDLAAAWPQRQGSRRRMITDAIVHRFLSWALLNPPPLWSANFFGMLVPR